jgi:transcriptional regulator with GAF, ATPase, and Fis domain
MRKTIEEGDKKLAGVYPALTTIVLARLSDNEDESDRTALINQVATEQGVLQYASKALGLLLVQIQQAVTRFEIMMDE